MIEVSFILPAYKRPFLRESIDSILAQTYRKFELVIVDDKSPEGLDEVIKEYSWAPASEALPDGGRKWIVDGIPIRYYKNNENIGGKDLVAAWEKAMAYANNDWCVLASDDDLYKPGYLEEMVRLITKYPDVNLCHCRLGTINANGELINIQCDRREYESGVRFLYNTFKYHRQAAPEFMFKRSALNGIGGFVRLPCAWGTDDATWSAIAMHGGVACSKDILFIFRRSGLNITTSQKLYYEKMTAQIKLAKWIEDFAANCNPVGEEEHFMVDEVISILRRESSDSIMGALWHGGFMCLLRMINDDAIPKCYKRNLLSAYLRQTVSARYHFSYLKRLFI